MAGSTPHIDTDDEIITFDFWKNEKLFCHQLSQKWVIQPLIMLRMTK